MVLLINLQLIQISQLIKDTVELEEQITNQADELQNLRKRLEELRAENENFKEIIVELESELEIEKNNVIEERKRSQSQENVPVMFESMHFVLMQFLRLFQVQLSLL